MGIPILSISDVSFSYGRRKVLDRVTFDVEPGRVTMLLGPNGAGKTTLFSLVARLLALQSGNIRIAGQSTRAADSAIMRQIGIVFQQPALDLDLTVRQNLVYFGRLLGLAKHEREKRLEEELARLDLSQRLRETVRMLNGGHRRRVEIARTLMARPPLLLLDEPTVGLDVSTRRSLVAFLHELAALSGIALLWATHLIDEVWPSDDIVVLSGGQIVARGTAGSIIAEAKANDLASAFQVLTVEQESAA